MTETAPYLPSNAPLRRASSPEAGPINRVARVLVGLALLAAGAFLIAAQESFRSLEAVTMSVLLRPVLGTDVIAAHDVFVFNEDSRWVGLRITPECSTLVVLTPILLFAAVSIVFLRRSGWRRWAAGVGVGLAMVTAINLSRLGMIAGAMALWGHAGYEWMHVVGGSAWALAGAVGAFLVMLRIVTGGRRKR